LHPTALFFLLHLFSLLHISSSSVQVMLQGAHLTVGGQTVFMPSFGAAYTDEELAAITNYVVGHFADRLGRVTGDQLRKAR
jgi:hypothetical protein